VPLIAAAGTLVLAITDAVIVSEAMSAETIDASTIASESIFLKLLYVAIYCP
jgi:hypothetical protein